MLVITEMQIETTMSYHLILAGMAVTKKKKSPGKDVEKETLMLSCWECKLVQFLWETARKFLKKLRSRTTMRSSHPSCGSISKTIAGRMAELPASPSSCSVTHNSHEVNTT